MFIESNMFLSLCKTLPFILRKEIKVNAQIIHSKLQETLWPHSFSVNHVCIKHIRQMSCLLRTLGDANVDKWHNNPMMIFSNHLLRTCKLPLLSQNSTSNIDLTGAVTKVTLITKECNRSHKKNKFLTSRLDQKQVVDQQLLLDQQQQQQLHIFCWNQLHLFLNRKLKI